MSRKQSHVAKPAEYGWQIFRIRSTAAAKLGNVTAPDEKTAIE
jgi:hypothetical protein